MQVPFLDLKKNSDFIKNEIAEALNKVLDKTAFAGGPFVAEFENNFAEFCHCRYTVGVGSGTEALWSALIGFGVGPGDEVITVPNSFIATAEAISFCGAKPVFVDVDEKTYTMNPDLFEKAVNKHTKAVIPVHLFGQTADIDPIIEIAERHNLFVIEDACQAHGAAYKGRPAGSMGDAGCFSFYPGKNLGAYGEAGAVTTNNEELYRTIMMFRDHGQSKKYHHDIIGWNSRMDGFQGAVLNIKLPYLRQWSDERRNNAMLYNELLADVCPDGTPCEAEYAEHVYHIYALLMDNRDNLMQFLSEHEIASGIHYPVPIHLTSAYRDLGYAPGDFPVAERLAGKLVSLPMYPELSQDQIFYVCQNIKSFCQGEQ